MRAGGRTGLTRLPLARTGQEHHQISYAEYLQPQAPACCTLKTFGFLLIPNFTAIGFA